MARRAPSDTILASCLHQIYDMKTRGGPARKIAGMFGTCERSYQTTGRSGKRGWLGTTRAQQSFSGQVNLRHPRIGDTTHVKGLSPGSFYSIHPGKRYRQGPERAQAYPMIGAHDFDVSPLHILAEVEEAYQTIQRKAERLIERRERRQVDGDANT